MRRSSRLLLIGSVIGSCIGCDQVTKVAAQQHLAGAAPLRFLGGTLRLSYAENPGAFLGFGSDWSSQTRFWVLGLAVALVLTWVTALALADRRAGWLHVVGLALIVGGGVGNLIDRAATGVVRDFINVGVGSLRTGIFNVADLAITTGAVVLFVSWSSRTHSVPADRK